MVYNVQKNSLVSVHTAVEASTPEVNTVKTSSAESSILPGISSLCLSNIWLTQVFSLYKKVWKILLRSDIL